MGAIFIPSPTSPDREPLVIVLRAGSRIASARTGQRVVLPPGEYEVVVGSGPMAERARQTVEVREGITAPVAPFFGSLRVSLVDRKGQPIDGEYVVARVGGGDAAVLGPFEVEGAERYRPGPTLLLKPGTYVVAVGDEPDAAEGRVAIRVSAGETMRYRLVVDDGDRLLRADLADTEVTYEPSIWRLRWLIGADVMLGYRNETLSGFNGGVIMLDAFTSFEGGVDTQNHLALVAIKANQSLIGLDSQNGISTPIQSLINEATGELSYSYRLARIVGPYVRGIAWTSFVPNGYYPENDSVVTTRTESGTVVSTETAPQGDRLSMFDALAPTIVQESAGFGVSPVDTRTVNLTMRGGFAARQTFYLGGRHLEDVSGTQIGMLELEDRFDYGPELTAKFGLRLASNLTYETRFEGFVPGDQIVDGADFKPLVRWDNTLGLRLNDFASLVYDGSVRQMHVPIVPIQTSHTLTVRLHYAIF